MMERRGVEKPTMFKTGFETIPEEHDNLGNLLGRLNLDRERKSIVDSLRKTGEKLDAFFKSTDEESSGKWNRLVQKITLIAEAGGTLGEKIANSKLKGTFIANNISSIISLAEQFLIEDAIKKQGRLAGKHDQSTHDRFLKAYNPYQEMSLFTLCGEVFIKIHGMTTSEIIGQEHYISPFDYFKWLMEANLIRSLLLKDKNKQILQKAFRENSDSALIRAYPNDAKNKINECCGQIMSLAAMTPEYFDRLWKSLFPSTNAAEEEIKQKARKIVERASALLQKSLNTVFTPDSPEFPSLKNILEDYLNKSLTERTVALAILGLNTIPKAVKTYRKARKLALRDTMHSPFYERLGNCIKDHVEQFPTNINILTKDDVIMFLNGDNQQNNPATFADFKLIINNEVFRQYIKHQGSFLVDPQTVENWQGVLKPNSVRAVFSEENLDPNLKFNLKLNPNEFEIFFNYESGEGEEQHLSVTVNARREEIDWDFLEDPNDPEMKDMKEAIMLSVKSVLQYIQKQTEPANQEKQKQEVKKVSPLLPKNNTKKSTEGIHVPREKFEKPEIQKPLTPFQQALNEEITAEIKPEVKRQICLEEENIKNIMYRQNVPENNQVRIIATIKRFNLGIGKLKSLRFKDLNRGLVWELRTGDFRVLVTEKAISNGSSLNGNGMHLFEIIDVGARKEVFKKASNKGIIAI